MGSIHLKPVVERTWAVIPALAILWTGGALRISQYSVNRFPDSGGYIIGESPEDWGLLSFTGQHIRAWPTVLFYAIFQQDDLRIVAQCFLYLTAWTLFLIAWFPPIRKVLAIVGSTVLAALALSPPAWQWNETLLAESTAISFLVIALALFGFGLRATRFQIHLFVASLLSVLVVCLVRVQLLPVLLTLAILSVAVLVIRRHQGWSRGVLLLTVVTVASFLYAGWLNQQIDDYWAQGAAQTTRSTTNFFFLTATDSADDVATDTLYEAAREPSPPCLDGLRASMVDAPGPYVFSTQQTQRCPDGIAWLNSRFNLWYASWIIRNPSYVAQVGSTYLPRAYLFSPYAEIQATPIVIEDYLWYPRSLSIQGWLLWLLIPIGFGIVAVAIPRPASKFAIISLSGIQLSLALGLLIGFLAMNAEEVRVSAVGAHCLIACSITGLLYSVDTFSRMFLRGSTVSPAKDTRTVREVQEQWDPKSQHVTFAEDPLTS